MLELRAVTKQFGKDVKAADGLSLSLRQGVVGLNGHKGAGKSTLMGMIATLTRPSAGRILFDGADIVRKPGAIRRRLGCLPQDFGVYPNLSAFEFMQYFAALKGGRDTARIRRLLELVNLHDQASRPAASFSGGMKRRRLCCCWASCLRAPSCCAGVPENRRALAAVAGLVALAGCAALFGLLSRTPRPFLGLFLFGLYVMVNAKCVPMLDVVGVPATQPAVGHGVLHAGAGGGSGGFRLEPAQLGPVRTVQAR